MPLVKRAIEPSLISRKPIKSDVKNELECVSNNTLSMIILQLSSLSKQSDDLFGELFAETCTLANRTSNLSKRIDGLKQKICQLNPIVEEVLLQEINQRKPFKSLMCRDQQIIIKSTRPYSINEVYQFCEKPPALNKLDVFREDNVDSLKFYTNPEYFAELWFADMKAAQHQQKKQKHKHSQLRSNSKPKTLRTPKNKLDEFKDLKHGPEFVDKPIRKAQQQVPIELQRVNSNYCATSAKSPDSNLKHNKLTIVHPNNKEIYDGNNAMYNQYGLEVDKEINYDGSAYSDYMQQERQRMSDCRSNSVSQISSPRPSAPPPAPPTSTMLKKHSSISQSALAHSNNDNNYNVVQQYQQIQQQMYISPNHTLEAPYLSNLHDQQSQGNQAPSMNLNAFSTANSDLPPPPSPPPFHQDQTLDFPNQSFSPNNITPPPPNFNTSDHFDNGSLPPPPPLPNSLLPKLLPYGMVDNRNIHVNMNDDNDVRNIQARNNFQPDEESINSNSTTTTDTNVEIGSMANNKDIDNMDGKRLQMNVGDKGPLVRDTRSDLLSAIREGIQLRKVEENRLKSEQKQTKKGSSLDVQSIMEAAFELRRKVMENDEDEDEDDENNWSD